MEKINQSIPENFSIQFTGEFINVSDYEKSQINELLSNFVSKFHDTFSEGILFVDLKYNKGHYHKGKYRGQPLAQVNMRLSTDKGTFMAKKENWGARSALHDSIIVLNNQIRTEMHRRTGKERAYNLISERRRAEA